MIPFNPNQAVMKPFVICRFIACVGILLGWLSGGILRAQDVVAAFAPIFPVTTQEDTPVSILPITIYTTATDVSRFQVRIRWATTPLLLTNSVILRGTGTNWTLSLIPVPNRSGAVSMQLTLLDGGVPVATTSFPFTVHAVKDPPVLGPIPDQVSVVGETVLPIALSVQDPDGGDPFVFSFTSSNPRLIPSGTMRVVSGTGQTNFLILQPNPGVTGSATLQVAVSQPGAAAVAPSIQSFVFTRRPALFTAAAAAGIGVGNAQAVVADFGGPNGLMWWTPHLGLSKPAFFDTAGVSNESVDREAQAEVADFNGDGRPDLVLMDAVRHRFQIWINESTAKTNRFRLQSTTVVAGAANLVIGAVADFDRDGNPDVLIVGINGVAARIYRNLGGGREFLASDVTGVAPGAQVRVGDFDGDGWPDLLLWRPFGVLSEAAGLAQIWRNNQHGSFEPWSSRAFTSDLPGIPNANGGYAGSVDYDGDGRLDVWLTYTSLSRPFLGLFLNRGNGLFVAGPQRPIGPSNAGDGATTAMEPAVADFDGDGWPDFLVFDQQRLGPVGVEPNNRLQIAFLRNPGNGTLGEPIYALPWIGSKSWISLADVDGDGALDPILVGPSFNTAVFTNRFSGLNRLPGVPRELQGYFDGHQLWLHWEPALDGNQKAGLTYEVRVGTAPGQSDVLSALADPLTGRRRAWQPGNAGLETTLVLTPPAGRLAGGQRLYWSVQAIDASLAGGGFAAEESILIGSKLALADPPNILPIADVDLGTGQGTQVQVSFGDNRTPASAVQLQMHVDRPDLLDLNLVYRADEKSGNLAVAVVRKSNAGGRVNVTVEAIDSDGNIATRGFQVVLAARVALNTPPAVAVLRYGRTATGSVSLVPESTGVPVVYESSEDLVKWDPVTDSVAPDTGGLKVAPEGFQRFFRQRVR